MGWEREQQRYYERQRKKYYQKKKDAAAWVLLRYLPDDHDLRHSEIGWWVSSDWEQYLDGPEPEDALVNFWKQHNEKLDTKLNKEVLQALTVLTQEIPPA